jgi:hypothetical protein
VAQWREIFIQLVDAHAREEASRAQPSGDKENVAWDAEYARVYAALNALERRLQSEPSRTFGDIVLRAAVARYWVGEDESGQMRDLNDANDDASEEAYLIRAILQVAGLPADKRWQVALEGTTRLSRLTDLNTANLRV